jgi:hypothetical protein
MGLDATVYRSLTNLPVDLRERVIRNPESGEIIPRDQEDSRLFDSLQFEAWHERIGNISLVASLREEIARTFGDSENLLSKKVLYSGSHTGDYIAFSEVDALSLEIEKLEKLAGTTCSSELTTFIGQMRKLIAAANREGNGIVF